MPVPAASLLERQYLGLERKLGPAGDGLTDPREPPAEPPKGDNAGTSYIVQPGDTLWDIAVRLLGDGTKWQTIAKLNGIDPNNPIISIGAVLKIPGGGPSTQPNDPNAPNDPGPKDPGYKAWLMQDPDYADFMAQFGLDRSNYMGDRRLAIARLRNDLTLKRAARKEALRDATTSVNKDFEGRGMFFSGGRMVDLAERYGDIDDRYTEFYSQNIDEREATRLDFRKKLADLWYERARQARDAATRLTAQGIDPTQV
jgi:hypothetical protein